MTPAELFDKIDWEGGFYEAVTSYGLDVSDLVTDDAELASLWRKAMVATFSADVYVRQFMGALEEAQTGCGGELMDSLPGRAEMTGFSYTAALEVLALGGRVRRAAWLPGSWLTLVSEHNYQYLAMNTSFGLMPYQPNYAAQVATDWLVD